MKSYQLHRLLLLLFLVYCSRANGLCFLDKQTSAQCHELEDARYIETYHLHVLRAPSHSRTLKPGNFLNFTSLRHLDLSGGKIERIESNSFAHLSHLQTLNLADNRITHLDADAFDGLKHLHSLKLSNNAIKHLPSALMSLKELRLLDVSNNPLSCNCASLKLRDALVSRGVKISKKTHCAEPASIKFTSILKPDTKINCEFEKQDLEMQGDQPVEDNVEGSGEVDADDALEEADIDASDFGSEELPSVTEKKSEKEHEIETPAPPTSIETITTEATLLAVTSTEAASSETTSSTAVSQEITSSTKPHLQDDIIIQDTEDPLKKEVTTESWEAINKEETTPPGVLDDLIYAVLVPKSTTEDSMSTSTTLKPKIIDEVIAPVEGSGENDDDGSGSEGSGMIAQVPEIDFNETSVGFGEEETQLTSSSTTTTTESSSWWGLGDIISNLNPWGSYESTEATTSTTEGSAEDDLKEEQFIKVTQNPPIGISGEEVEEPIAPPKVIITDEISSRQSPRTHELDNDLVSSRSADVDDNGVDTAFSQESKKGMGSYIVLAIILAVLAGLIGFAAYKGDFCRKKRKRGDVEKGTEMRDMQKSLLDQNSTTPKIQVANGNTLENVPLMNSAPPEEPKENQRSYDITPTTNGATRSNGPTMEAIDPVKPPRKALSQEIEAPLNGLNPPMDDIDAPEVTDLQNGSNEIINNGHYGDRPPQSPGAQRVKITLQENPDSVPKTPILITRLKGGENLVKAP